MSPLNLKSLKMTTKKKLNVSTEQNSLSSCVPAANT